MEILKRILGIASIVVSLIFIVACLAGVFFSWSINTPITIAVTGVFTGVEHVLTAAENGLERVNTQLFEAQTNIDTIEENVYRAEPQFAASLEEALAAANQWLDEHTGQSADIDL